MADGTDFTWQQATNLAGKRVLLTGCASGIGRATAELYAQAGAIVYGGDVNVAAGEAAMAAIRAAGVKSTVLNLMQPESIDTRGHRARESRWNCRCGRKHRWHRHHRRSPRTIR
jgi:NADP-dependent 3-hydroxy acid dehydrogenase YdfG